MKKILLFFSFISLVFSGKSQVIGDYNLLIADGTLSPDAQAVLTAMGHTVTIDNPSNMILGYDYSPYDAIIFMYDSSLPPGFSEILTLNESCDLGIILFRSQDIIVPAGMGTSITWDPGDFTIEDNSHYITQPFSLGILDLDFTFKTNLTAGGAPNTTVLGSVAGGNGSLVVHDLYKRVISPYYGHSDGMPWNADAELLMDRIIAWAVNQCCPETTSSFNVSVCDEYTVPSGDETYTVSGIYMDTIPNTAGCDSVMTIDVEILNSTASNLNQTACDSYTLNSQTYTTTGIYTQVIPNAAGCDSTINLDLVVNYSSSNTIDASSCTNYTLNSQTYSSSGTYTQTLTNAAGCDSVITLNLTIGAADVTVTQNGGTFSGPSSGVWFQWVDCNNGMAPIPGAFNIDFTPSVNGSYAVIVSTLSCSDTSLCYDIDDVGVNENETLFFNVKPNPANGQVFITFNQPQENSTLQLINSAGQVVLSQTGINGTNFEMHVELLPSGIYFIELFTNGSIERMRLVKN